MDAKRYVACFHKREKREFSSVNRFSGSSSEALHLLEGMLDLNPARRFTVDEALQHPFFPKVMGALYNPREQIKEAPHRIHLGFETLDIRSAEQSHKNAAIITAQLRVHFILQLSKFRQVEVPPELIAQIPHGEKFVRHARAMTPNAQAVMKSLDKRSSNGALHGGGGRGHGPLHGGPLHGDTGRCAGQFTDVVATGTTMATTDHGITSSVSSTTTDGLFHDDTAVPVPTAAVPGAAPGAGGLQRPSRDVGQRSSAASAGRPEGDGGRRMLGWTFEDHPPPTGCWGPYAPPRAG